MRQATRFFQTLLSTVLLLGIASFAHAAEPFALKKGDKIVLIGGTNCERMQYFGHWETLLHARHPEKQLIVRNLGFSGDTITIRLRSKDFQDHGHTLFDHQPNVILANFGFNESFAGPKGLPQFKADLAKFITEVRAYRYPSIEYERGSQTPVVQDKNGPAPQQPPTLVMISPMANEDLTDRNILAGTWNNANLALYSAAMEEVCKEQNIPFVDLFTSSKAALPHAVPVTFNGVHLSETGEKVIGELLDGLLFGSPSKIDWNSPQVKSLHAEVQEKNKQFWYDYRAINGYYIYGGRKKPFGVVNYPAEFAKLRKMIAVRDQRVWSVAAGQKVAATIDDSGTGDFVEVETNYKNTVNILSPEDALKAFHVAEGFEINLWASEVEFPNLQNPVQFAFDAKGRIWVTTMPTYPQYLPGTPVHDKVIIYEDTNGDGKADKETIFADGLHIPTGIELGDGGAYVAQQPNLMFLKDTNGDDVADERTLLLTGFDSGDSHHSIGAFEWGPGGDLYFAEGTFHHSQIETPYGLKRVHNSAYFRYEPKSEKFDIFVTYNFANPWGICWDHWGQTFIADASGGANYWATPFTGDIDYPRQHPGLKEFLVKQWRPTAGCEIVSSRHFPDEMQGNYLLNNCIGFQGVLQYRMKDAGSGFAADPVEPLLSSTDPNFRPVDLQFGADGALYIIDWFNPLVGHMQHSLRDPNRDKVHGRIWRVTCKNRPLVERPTIAGAPTAQLVQLLSEYEDRTRYAVRRELRERPTAEVVTTLDKWVAGLKGDSPEVEHQRLEALWVKQHHNVIDEKLLGTVLASKDPRARAAATRVLCYWRDNVADPLGQLQKLVSDDHPRVRAEALRALSFFHGDSAAKARDIAYESLTLEQDLYLEYVFKETLETLDRRVK
ncbi:MAG: GDSL-type esterase/lipase family protein [Planctomycetaceae bacterium]